MQIRINVYVFVVANYEMKAIFGRVANALAATQNAIRIIFGRVVGVIGAVKHEMNLTIGINAHVVNATKHAITGMVVFAQYAVRYMIGCLLPIKRKRMFAGFATKVNIAK